MKELPKYKLLADIIRKEILDNDYPVGTKLSTENELAEKYSMSRQTVRQAIGLLESQGIVTKKHGSGTYLNNTADKNLALVQSKSMTIGVISTYITEYIFPSIVRGIEGVFTENNYSLLLSATGNRFDNERKLLLDYIDKKVDGLIVEGTKTTLPNPNISIYKKIKDLGIPVVFINGYYSELNPVYVVVDDYNGGYKAVDYLVRNGHKRIAGIFKSDDMQGINRFSGFSQALLNAEIELHDDNIIWFTTDSKEDIFNEKNTEALLNSINGCTSIVCYNDQIAVKLINILQKTGIIIPNNITIVSFDNSHYNALTPIELVSFNHPKEELGRAAAQKLINMIDGKIEKPCIMSWDIVE